jgi:hypothetical protein
MFTKQLGAYRDKPRPYLLGEALSVGAGFISARKGLKKVR